MAENLTTKITAVTFYFKEELPLKGAEKINIEVSTTLDGLGDVIVSELSKSKEFDVPAGKQAGINSFLADVSTFIQGQIAAFEGGPHTVTMEGLGSS